MSNIDNSSKQQSFFRKKLWNLFKKSGIPKDQTLNHLNLFIRSSIYARQIHYYELYNFIKDNNGLILIYGFNYGSIITSFLSLRAIIEPYNYSRKIIGFENFVDSNKVMHFEENKDNFTPDKYGQYFDSEDYYKYLNDVFDYHEGENMLSNIKKVELFYNDPVVDTTKFIKENKDLSISLVYFDRTFIDNLSPLFELIVPYFNENTIICPSTINSYIPTGELDSIRKCFNNKITIKNSKYIPEKVYIKIK